MQLSATTQFLKKVFNVSIPQAVGTVATGFYFRAYAQGGQLVSIPQAVGTVATSADTFNGTLGDSVSIPQAVGTVATRFH